MTAGLLPNEMLRSVLVPLVLLSSQYHLEFSECGTLLLQTLDFEVSMTQLVNRLDFSPF